MIALELADATTDSFIAAPAWGFDSADRTLRLVDTAWRQHDPVSVRSIIDAKLTTLTRLTDGWLGEGSRKPTPIAISHYLAFLDALGEDVTLAAEPIALSDGGIRVEWEFAERERVIEIGPAGNVWMLAETADADADREQALDQFDPAVLREFFDAEK